MVPSRSWDRGHGHDGEGRRIILDRHHAEHYGENLHHDHGGVEGHDAEHGAREEHHERGLYDAAAREGPLCCWHFRSASSCVRPGCASFLAEAPQRK